MRLRAPLAFSPDQARNLLEQNASWIAKAIAKAQEPQRQHFNLDACPLAKKALGARTFVYHQSARTKRFSLSVSRVDGKVRLSAPAMSSLKDAAHFLESHVDWLTDTLNRSGAVILFADGTAFPIEGETYTIVAKAGRTITQDVNTRQLRVGATAGLIGPKVETWLKHRARERLVIATKKYAALFGVTVSRITLKDTSSRWGSCSMKGAINYSWRLVMAPPAVLDYVAAHEVAHRLEMNHSRAFWSHVESVCPDWRRRRDWLKTEGAYLHRFRSF